MTTDTKSRQPGAPLIYTATPTRSPEEAAAALMAVAPGLSGVRAPEWRWWRWVAELEGDHIAFVAEDDEGWARLEKERMLLARLAKDASFSAPTVVALGEKELVQVRRKVPGTSGVVLEDMVFGREASGPAEERYRPDSPITAQGQKLARDLGRALCELHRAIPAEEATALGFPTVSCLATLDAVEEKLFAREDLSDLRGAAAPLRRWLSGLPSDFALCHRDIQMHNIAVDLSTGALLGLFDFDDAAVSHRLEDFKYFPSFGLAFSALALDAYAEAGGPRLALDDIGRFHLLSALEHLLFVAEDSARWPQIIDWSRAAMESFLNTA